MSPRIAPETWRLAQLRPNCLAIAERNLTRQGFRIFCPTEEITRRRGGRFVTVTAPLFPGYLFVCEDEGAAPLRAINSTYGVSRLVTFSEQFPAEVPKAIIAGLMSRCDESGMLKPVESLTPGEDVRIVSGPFADFVGTVENLGPQERVWVLLELLGGPTRVALKSSNVQRV